MDLVNWSFNAIDTIFSKIKVGSGEPNCPDGTTAAGYVMDSWGKWNVMCLAPLNIEDVEDVYTFGYLVASSLGIGLSLGLLYRICSKVWAAIRGPRLSGSIDRVGSEIRAQNVVVNRALEGFVAGQRQMDKLTEVVVAGHRHLEAIDRRIDGLVAHDRQMESIGLGDRLLEILLYVKRVASHMRITAES